MCLYSLYSSENATLCLDVRQLSFAFKKNMIEFSSASGCLWVSKQV